MESSWKPPNSNSLNTTFDNIPPAIAICRADEVAVQVVLAAAGPPQAVGFEYRSAHPVVRPLARVADGILEGKKFIRIVPAVIRDPTTRVGESGYIKES